MTSGAGAEGEMSLRPRVGPLVAVVDSVHIFRTGLLHLFAAAGYRTATPVGDPRTWITEHSPDLVVMTARVRADADLIEWAREAFPSIAVIAIVESPSRSTYVDMLRSGATAVLPSDVSGDRLVAAVAAAMNGDSTIPRDVASVLYGRVRTDELNDEEIRLVRDLAHGRTVSLIARKMGFSERNLHRQLSKTYQKLGVRNRSEAIAEAGRRGLLQLSGANAVSDRYAPIPGIRGS